MGLLSFELICDARRADGYQLIRLLWIQSNRSLDYFRTADPALNFLQRWEFKEGQRRQSLRSLSEGGAFKSLWKGLSMPLKLFRTPTIHTAWERALHSPPPTFLWSSGRISSTFCIVSESDSRSYVRGHCCMGWIYWSISRCYFTPKINRNNRDYSLYKENRAYF